MENIVQLFYEPLNILKDLNMSEMSDYDLAFLCGCIKKYKPQKIVEIGIGSGSTTGVILNALKILGMNTSEVHSIDSSENYYRDLKKPTGFHAEQLKESMGYVTGEHKWYLGKLAPECLEMIGNNIDLLIIDTDMVLPSQLFDFIASFPFLSRNAIVMLHDGWYNLLGKNPNGYSSKIIYNSVAADKIIEKEVNCNPEFSMLAFKINEDTLKYIGGCISNLSITWPNCPSNDYLKKYSKMIRKYYSEDIYEQYKYIIAMQLLYKICKKHNECKVVLSRLLDFCKTRKELFVTGNEECIKKFELFIKDFNIKVHKLNMLNTEIESGLLKKYISSNIDVKEKSVIVACYENVNNRIARLIENGYSDIFPTYELQKNVNDGYYKQLVQLVDDYYEVIV